jgi:hypothetical protein
VKTQLEEKKPPTKGAPHKNKNFFAYDAQDRSLEAKLEKIKQEKADMDREPARERFPNPQRVQWDFEDQLRRSREYPLAAKASLQCLWQQFPKAPCPGRPGE